MRQEERDTAAQNVAIADFNVTLAKQQFARVSVLAAKNYASRQQYDEDAAALSKAEASLVLANAALDQTKAGPTKEELAVAQSQVALALATVADLEAQLAKTTLTSPVDGVARLLVAERGEAISPGQPVLTLAVGGDRWFTFTIREDRLQGLTMGSKIALRTAAGDRFEAKVTELRPLGECGLARGARGRGPRHQQLSSARRSDRPNAEARAGHDGVDRRGARRRGALKEEFPAPGFNPPMLTPSSFTTAAPNPWATVGVTPRPRNSAAVISFSLTIRPRRFGRGQGQIVSKSSCQIKFTLHGRGGTVYRNLWDARLLRACHVQGRRPRRDRRRHKSNVHLTIMNLGVIPRMCSEKSVASAGLHLQPRASVRLDLDRIRSAVLCIAPVFRNTPQYVCPPLGEALGCELILKLETANPIRCFKGRGTETLMARLVDSGSKAAVCASAGNLGQALGV